MPPWQRSGQEEGLGCAWGSPTLLSLPAPPVLPGEKSCEAVRSPAAGSSWHKSHRALQSPGSLWYPALWPKSTISRCTSRGLQNLPKISPKPSQNFSATMGPRIPQYHVSWLDQALSQEPSCSLDASAQTGDIQISFCLGQNSMKPIASFI